MINKGPFPRSSIFCNLTNTVVGLISVVSLLMDVCDGIGCNGMEEVRDSTLLHGHISETKEAAMLPSLPLG